jgi:hypothetical protein
MEFIKRCFDTFGSFDTIASDVLREIPLPGRNEIAESISHHATIGETL